MYVLVVSLSVLVVSLLFPVVSLCRVFELVSPLVVMLSFVVVSSFLLVVLLSLRIRFSYSPEVQQ